MDGPESPVKSASGVSNSHSDNGSEPRSGNVMEGDIEAIVSSESNGSSSSSTGSEEVIEDTLGFPSHQLQKLNEGLNRGSWVVHIICLVDCERVAAALIKHPDR